MTNYTVKVKINDYFPKIDAIPFDNYICVISCNNSYSKIKLSEYNYQYFKHTFKLIKNTDLLFNVKLINYLENNTLIGIYDLLIPYTKVNQILQRNTSFYQQQIKLIMNSNVKIKLFGTMMNITSIYLDLIFEISLIENKTSSLNKIRIYDIIGSKTIEELMPYNNQKILGNDNFQIDNNQKNRTNFMDSPDYNNNIIYDTYDKGFNDKKQFNTGKSYVYNYNNNKYNNEKHSDINYNVMNNNYLNYFKIDNNNFPVDYKFNINNNNININNKSPNNNINNNTNMNNIEKDNKINRNNFLKLNNNINKINNLSIPREKNINNNNINRYKKKENLARSPYLIHTERFFNINENYLDNSGTKNLTEVKNSMESDTKRKKYDPYKNKKNLKFQYNDNKIIKNLNYVNYIKNNRVLLHDKKNQIQKYLDNRLKKKTPNSIFDMKDIEEKQKEKENINLKVDENKKDKIKIDINKPNKSSVISKLKTPQKKKDSNFNIYQENNNNDNLFELNVSNIKNINNNDTELNTLENDKKNLSKIKIKNHFSLNNSNIKNKKKKSFSKKLETKRNTNDKDNENNNLSNIDNIKRRIHHKSNIIIKNRELNNINNLIITTPEDIKDKVIKFLNDNIKLTKEIKDKINNNKNLYKKLLLNKQTYYTELKINNHLNSNINTKDIKYLIHVNVRSKLNEKLYFKMKRIKIKEFKIFQNIFYDHKNSPEYKAKEAKRKIQEKFEQQKKVHALLKVIRELIQKYENLSQLYNDDEKKKILFKSLLVRYGVREKEETKENNLIDKYKEIQKKMEEEKNNNLIKIKTKEIQNDIYKNVIKEEDDEEKSSVSEKMKNHISFKKRFSWQSEDSLFKEKDNNADENNNSILSSGLKIIKENQDEDILKEKDNISSD